MNALMTLILLTGAITSTDVGPQSFPSNTPIESPRLTPAPIGSGFQSPWMHDTRLRPPMREPVSPLAIVAMVIVYVTFLAIVIWAVAIESIRLGQRRDTMDDDDPKKDEPPIDTIADRRSRIDAWLSQDKTEARN